jgi:hypothetical protein
VGLSKEPFNAGIDSLIDKAKRIFRTRNADFARFLAPDKLPAQGSNWNGVEGFGPELVLQPGIQSGRLVIARPY